LLYDESVESLLRHTAACASSRAFRLASSLK
jgi:hypothetical protein